jgi:iron complex transport system substrate-binding protein
MTRSALLLALGLLAVACGGQPRSGSQSTPPAAATQGSATPVSAFPITVSAANGLVTIEQEPGRIVSLSPTATEVLFAIGAGEQVVAVDDSSDYPAEAPTTGLSGLEPNIEAIAGFDPDLVVVSNDFGLQDPLAALDIPLLLQPAAEDLTDVYEQIEQLGAATGHPTDAASVVAAMRSEIESVVGSVPEFSATPTYYHELDPSYFSATSDTFIGKIYSLFGLQNIADRAADAGNTYPQLSAEYIVRADPDLIFLADTKCCGESAETVRQRPGWDQLTAVTSGGVVELDDDVASRWGPRVVDFIRVVAQGLDDLNLAAA